MKKIDPQFFPSSMMHARTLTTPLHVVYLMVKGTQSSRAGLACTAKPEGSTGESTPPEEHSNQYFIFTDKANTK